MRRHWKGLLSASVFLQDVFGSELQNSIFACINFRKYMGLDISSGFIFANEKDFTSKYNEKSGTIF